MLDIQVVLKKSETLNPVNWRKVVNVNLMAPITVRSQLCLISRRLSMLKSLQLVPDLVTLVRQAIQRIVY